MEGVKHDHGKAPLSMLPKAALDEEAYVMQFGAEKYGRWNYLKGMAYSRLLDACLRHVMAYSNGEDCDPETGYSHLAHARCCLGFLIEYKEKGLGEDDRRVWGFDELESSERDRQQLQVQSGGTERNGQYDLPFPTASGSH